MDNTDDLGEFIEEPVLIVEDESTETITGDFQESFSQDLIFEEKRSQLHRGVRGCKDRFNRMVQALVDGFADEKARETGLSPIAKGHRGAEYTARSGREGFPSNARWCRILVTVKCYVIFRR